MRNRLAAVLFIPLLACPEPEPGSGWVRSVPADSLVLADTNAFDLEGRGLRFVPTPSGYDVTVLDSSAFEPDGEDAYFTTDLVLPFDFPFAGTSWKQAWIDPGGRLVFGPPENVSWSPQTLWPTGTMHDVASAFRTRAATGIDRTIAVFWGIYEATHTAITSRADHVTITWRNLRPTPHSFSFEPNGWCTFQVALFADGVIELRYEQVPELDGIVGVFTGAPSETMLPAGGDLSSGGSFSGDAFEVFHHPLISTEFADLLPPVFERFAPEDDFVVLLTDFRIDTLWGVTATTGAVGTPIMGLGDSAYFPYPGSAFGSERLQAAVLPIWVGQPAFNELVSDKDRPYQEHAFAVGLLAHELTHRWGPGISTIVSESGEQVPLVEDACACHWNRWLNAPAVHPVASTYSPRLYPESSVMGGSTFEEVEPGIFTVRDAPYMAPAGFSALDLYLMGVIGPEEVPDTFLLRDVRYLDGDRVQATKVPVRISDIVAEMGPRIPDHLSSQRTFQLGVYLLHRGDGPDPEALRRADRIAEELAAFFDAATASGIRLVPPAARQ
ncbi:MAG: hypothetical protein WBV82_05490 [Myxococcaceae bacterium]